MLSVNEITGKTKQITVLGRDLTYFNQHHHGWDHPYAWQDNKKDLCDSGCGIFSLCHASQWLTGTVRSPEEWADFACTYGGRGDDGTDRPVLLQTLMDHHRAEELGFSYHGDGLRNDNDTLFDHLLREKGVSLCNLRVGHIVCLVAARELDGRREVLAVDSVAESDSEKVRDHVSEVLPGTENTCILYNRAGLPVGTKTSFGAFWVSADLPRDFNLLHRL